MCVKSILLEFLVYFGSDVIPISHKESVIRRISLYFKNSKHTEKNP
jgi:hypothetical protein